uniref:Uncharacterized protein n=1 Tax=Arundo donax TaxID=35708 RepID=A0A0A9B0H1_ARUDO
MDSMFWVWSLDLNGLVLFKKRNYIQSVTQLLTQL